MLPNRLIITKRSKREEIYKKSEKKWIIDFEDKIKSWSNFYDIVQKEMDFWNYNEKFRKDAKANSCTLLQYKPYSSQQFCSFYSNKPN